MCKQKTSAFASASKQRFVAMFVVALVFITGLWFRSETSKMLWGVIMFGSGCVVQRLCSCAAQGFSLSPEDYLQAVNLEQHQFLNHLQIIRGLNQLGKPEQAIDYVDSTSSVMRVKRNMWRLLPKSSSAAVAWWCVRCHNLGIDCQVDLQANLSGLKSEQTFTCLICNLLALLTVDKIRPATIKISSFTLVNSVAFEVAALGYAKTAPASFALIHQLAKRLEAMVRIDRSPTEVRLRIMFAAESPTK